MTVRLEPCGSARLRLVDPGGKPLGGSPRRGWSRWSLHPSHFAFPRAQKEYPLFADHALLGLVDPINHAKAPTADAHGRISLSCADSWGQVPHQSTAPRWRDPEGEKIRRDFSVKPGETLDLGDIVIEKPPAMR